MVIQLERRTVMVPTPVPVLNTPSLATFTNTHTLTSEPRNKSGCRPLFTGGYGGPSESGTQNRL